MSRIDSLLSTVSMLFFEEDSIDVDRIEPVLGGPTTLDHFVEKGILQFTGRNQIKFSFVGAIVANKKVIYILPKYSAAYVQSLQVDNGYYIKVIKKYVEYSARKSARKTVKDYLEDISLLMRTFDSLDKYFQRFGIFKENLSTFAKKQSGNINWSRTIQDMVPVHVPVYVSSEIDGGVSKLTSVSEAVIYPSPIHHSMSQQEGILSLIFRNVLTLLATIITPLLDRPHPLCLQMRQDGIASLLANLEDRRPYYARIVAQQIPREFGQRRAVLSSLLAFLRAEASVLDGAIRNKAFAFGVKKFSSVWEDACIRAVGGERGSHQLAKVIWRPRYGNGGEYQSRIDAKISSESGSGVILIDAKYYVVPELNIGSTENVEKIIPAYDVVKQFGYMVAYHLGTGTNLESIESAFILPRVSSSDFVHLGKIMFENLACEPDVVLAPIRPINLYGVDPRYLFDAYLGDQIIPAFMSFLSVSHEVIEKVAILKRQKSIFRVQMRKDESGVKVIGSTGQTKIPWLDGNQIARVKASVKDNGIIKILDEMHRKRTNRDSSGYFIKTDEIVQSFEAATILLGGDNPKTRKSVQIESVT